MTAQLVVTPREHGATFRDPAARAELSDVQAGAAALPNVLRVGDGSLRPDGRVALVRLQYAVLEELSRADLEGLKEFVAEQRAQSALRIEMQRRPVLRVRGVRGRESAS